MNKQQQDNDLKGKQGRRRFWVGILVLSIGVVILIVAGFLVSTTFIFRIDEEESAQNEAIEILEGIYDAEAVYFQEHECFDADPNRIAFTPAQRPRYYSWAIVHAGCGGYIARAWGNLDEDDAVDIWEITDYDGRKPMHVFSDEFDRGYAIDPESRENWRPTDGVFLPPAGRRD
jgi:hypothetical protein